MIIGLSIFVVVLGLIAIVSAFARGLGLTRGAILGFILVAVGTARLVIEARRKPTG